MSPRAHKRFLGGSLLVLAFVAPEGIAKIASGLRGPYAARRVAPSAAWSDAPSADPRASPSARVAERGELAASPVDLLALQPPADTAFASTLENLRAGR